MGWKVVLTSVKDGKRTVRSALTLLGFAVGTETHRSQHSMIMNGYGDCSYSPKYWYSIINRVSSADVTSAQESSVQHYKSRPNSSSLRFLLWVLVGASANGDNHVACSDVLFVVTSLQSPLERKRGVFFILQFTVAARMETHIQQACNKMEVTLITGCGAENKFSHVNYNIQHLFIGRERSEEGIGQIVLFGALLST